MCTIQVNIPNIAGDCEFDKLPISIAMAWLQAHKLHSPTQCCPDRLGAFLYFRNKLTSCTQIVQHLKRTHWLLRFLIYVNIFRILGYLLYAIRWVLLEPWPNAYCRLTILWIISVFIGNFSPLGFSMSPNSEPTCWCWIIFGFSLFYTYQFFKHHEGVSLWLTQWLYLLIRCWCWFS